MLLYPVPAWRSHGRHAHDVEKFCVYVGSELTLDLSNTLNLIFMALWTSIFVYDFYHMDSSSMFALNADA